MKMKQSMKNGKELKKLLKIFKENRDKIEKQTGKRPEIDDTTKMFEEPSNINQHITSFLTDDEIKLLAEKIQNV